MVGKLVEGTVVVEGTGRGHCGKGRRGDCCCDSSRGGEGKRGEGKERGWERVGRKVGGELEGREEGFEEIIYIL